MTTLSQGPVLVTGGSGFVGSHVVTRLTTLGVPVHALVRKTSDLWRLKDVLPKITLEYGDLTDQNSIKSVITRVKPSGIFHLGVSNVVSGVGADSETIIRTNVSGTVHLLDAAAAAGFDFFVMTGSFLEYGAKDHAVKEDERCEPGELYGATKLLGTLYGSSLARTQKKPIVTLRLFTPYGPKNEAKRLTHTLIASVLKDAPISLTAQNISRDFIYMDDAVDLLLEAAERAEDIKAEIFNAGSGIRTTLGEVVSLVMKKTGSKAQVEWGSFRNVSYDSDLWQADMTKTFARFRWRPKVSLEEGIVRTMEHFKTHGC